MATGRSSGCWSPWFRGAVVGAQSQWQTAGRPARFIQERWLRRPSHAVQPGCRRKPAPGHPFLATAMISRQRRSALLVPAIYFWGKYRGASSSLPAAAHRARAIAREAGLSVSYEPEGITRAGEPTGTALARRPTLSNVSDEYPTGGATAHPLRDIHTQERGSKFRHRVRLDRRPARYVLGLYSQSAAPRMA